MPVVFHKDGLLGEFEQVVLPDKYFGSVVGSEGTATTTDDNTSVRSLIETKYQVASGEADKRAKRANC